MDVIKSYKREVAGALLVFVGILTIKLFFFSTVEMIAALAGLYTAISAMVIPPSLTVFCFDFYMKKKDASPSS